MTCFYLVYVLFDSAVGDFYLLTASLRHRGKISNNNSNIKMVELMDSVINGT